jgi:ABC-type multidrug transport system permease subunit
LLLVLILCIGPRRASAAASPDLASAEVDAATWPTLRAIWGMARNDLAVWMNSPAAIAAALLPAIGMGVLVAMLTVSVGRQPVALVVQNPDRFSTRMARLIKADKDAYQLEEMTAAEAQSAFGDQRVAAIIVIPEDFDASLARSTAALDLYLNNVNIDISDDLRRAVTRSAAEFDAPQLGLLGELHGPSKGVLLPNPYRVAVAEHDLRETDVSFLQYQVIPIILLIVISVGVLGTALLTARDFERGTAKMVVISPRGHRALVLGRLLGGTLITIALVAPLVWLGFVTSYIPYCREESEAPLWVTLLLSGLCGWRLPVPSWTHASALVALFAAVTLATVGLGTLLGVAIRDARLVTMAGLNVAAYLFFLGGGFTTVAFLPDWIQMVSQFVPTSYAINGLRQALFYPDLIGFGRDLLVLALCAAASVALASLSLVRAWKRT